MKPPFFVIGAPRSGTTYLVQVLNHHPDLFITNETRVMTWAHRALLALGEPSFGLMHERGRFLRTLRDQLPSVIRSFYRELGADEKVRWGDKHPHYADPKADPGCLDLIDEFFPRSQFVHIVRDGRAVVASLLAKQWVDFDEAMDVWNRHVAHARQFGLRIGLDRYLELQYEDLYNRGEETVERLLDFLGVDAHADVSSFLEAQARGRTGFSGPTTADIGSTSWEDRLTPEQADKCNREMADLLVEFRYETYEWREHLTRTQAIA